MLFIEHIFHETKIAEVISDETVINNLQDALDLTANVSYRGITRIIVREEHLTDDFFNLRTGIAGEILQKCVNYGIKIAIVGSFEKYESKSLKAFVIECNRGNQFFFTSNKEEAIEKLGIV